MNSALTSLVWERAGNRCEYCRLHQDDEEDTPFHIEHIIAKKHRGSDEADNLCLSCSRCNSFKGPNLGGLHVGKIYPLYNPRRQAWPRHFYWEQTILIGKTATGIVTVHVLNINEDRRVEQQENLLFEGRFPPEET